MLEHEFEERLEILEKKVEELCDEKKDREEEATLIPGAEYDFVPSYKSKVIATGFAKIVGVRKASAELGLSQREWEQFSPDEEE